MRILILGYDLMWVNLSSYRVKDEHPVWAKVTSINDCFYRHPEAKWIWWLDFDAVVMTPTIDLGNYILNPGAMYNKILKDQKFPIMHLGQKVEEALHLPADPDPEDIHLLISHDQNGLNAGSFFLRRSNWTQIFLELWNDPILMLEKKWWAHEQDALVHLFLHHHQFMKHHVGIAAPKEFNAYVPDDINRESLSTNINLEADFWQPYDLVIHFAGCWSFPHPVPMLLTSSIGLISIAKNGGISIGHCVSKLPGWKTELGAS